MNDDIFNECSKYYDANEKEFWGKLAKKYNFSSGNALRKRYQRARKARGLSLKVNINSKLDIHNDTCVTENVTRKDLPKILVFDIETLPILAFTWKVYDTIIPPENIVEDYKLVSWSSKWLFDENIISMVMTPEEALAHDDSRLAKGIWQQIDSADIVVTYNGDKFDLKRANSRFIANGLSMPNPYRKSVDLLKVMRNVFGNTSNKLDYTNKILGLSRKIENAGMTLWSKCFFGDATSLKEMETYNRGDVKITESLYLHILPWIMNHPNLNIWSDSEEPVCRNCGCSVLTWDDRYYYTHNAKYQQCHCEKCGSIGRGKKNLITKEKRKNLIV